MTTLKSAGVAVLEENRTVEVEDDASLGGQNVRLRRVVVDDAELLERWQSLEYTGEFNDFGLHGGSLRDHIQENGLISGQGGTLIVVWEAKRRPIGTISWRQVHYGPPPESSAWNIGFNLFPEARGQGFGGEAQRLVPAHLFATTRINRIEAMTDIDNVAEQHSLEKAGFVREGVLRGAQYRRGGWHDLVVYSRIRSAS